jgi:hypothetical protein
LEIDALEKLMLRVLFACVKLSEQRGEEVKRFFAYGKKWKSER